MVKNKTVWWIAGIILFLLLVSQCDTELPTQSSLEAAGTTGSGGGGGGGGNGDTTTEDFPGYVCEDCTPEAELTVLSFRSLFTRITPKYVCDGTCTDPSDACTAVGWTKIVVGTNGATKEVEAPVCRCITPDCMPKWKDEFCMHGLPFEDLVDILTGKYTETTYHGIPLSEIIKKCPISDMYCSGPCTGSAECAKTAPLTCECITPEDELDCGWHLPFQIVPVGEIKDSFDVQPTTSIPSNFEPQDLLANNIPVEPTCYGGCPTGQDCVITKPTIFSVGGECVCVGEELPEEQLCQTILFDNIRITEDQKPIHCSTYGRCDVSGESCVYNEDKNGCTCESDVPVDFPDWDVPLAPLDQLVDSRLVT